MRNLTAIPVHNEERHIEDVLRAACKYSSDLLVIDDGSTDNTAALLARRSDIRVSTFPRNEGYGAALIHAFQFACDNDYDSLVTMDCDGQHEPKRIPELLEQLHEVDIVSGSRYLKQYDFDSIPPEDRRRLNVEITAELNRRFSFGLTDGFCGFKAYRTDALRRLSLTEPGYGMPLELWVQAHYFGLRIIEWPVPLIYLDEARAFGGSLDDVARRRAYYYDVIERAVARMEHQFGSQAPRDGDR